MQLHAPLDTVVPLNNVLVLSYNIALSLFNGFIYFYTGFASPVTMDWSKRKVVVNNFYKRKSAGTLSPYFN